MIRSENFPKTPSTSDNGASEFKNSLMLLPVWLLQCPVKLIMKMNHTNRLKIQNKHTVVVLEIIFSCTDAQW